MRAGKVVAITAGGVVALLWAAHLATSTTLALGPEPPRSTATATPAPSLLDNSLEPDVGPAPSPTTTPVEPGPTTTETQPPPVQAPAGLAQKTWTSSRAARTGTFTVVVKSVVHTQDQLTVVFAYAWDAPSSQSAVLGDFLVPDGTDPYLYVKPAFLTQPSGAMSFPLCADGNLIVNGHVRTPSETTCYQVGLFEPKDPWHLTITGGQWVEATLMYAKRPEGTTTINLVLPGGMPTFLDLPITYR